LKNLPAHRHARLVAVVASVFVLMWLIAALFLDYRRDESKKHLLAQISATQEVAWQAAKVVHRDSVQTYFNEYIMKPRTLELLRLAQDAADRDVARTLLYRHLYGVYTGLQEQGLRQLHFHLPNGDSLLRFHRPVRFGDNLMEIRPAIRIANTEFRPVFDFEAGRVMSGFRSVFPVMDVDGTHLGSVELSMPFDAIRQVMQSLLPQREFEMLLHARVVSDILFDEQKPLYGVWAGSERFVLEDPHHVLPDAPPPLSDEAKQVVAHLLIDGLAQTALAENASTALSVSVGDAYFTTVLTSIIDAEGDQVGFIASYAPETSLQVINADFLTNLALTTLLLLLLATTSYVLLKQNVIKLFERKRLQTINDTLGEGLYVMDDKGVITHVNRRACELLGYAERDLLDHVAHDLFHGDTGNGRMPLALCPVFTTVMRGEQYDDRQTFRCKNGDLFVASVTSRPIVQDSLVVASVTSFRDISEQVLMQEALRESEVRYRSVVESVKEVIFQTDVDGRWTFLNPAWTEISGYTIDESLGMHSFEYVQPDDHGRVRELFETVLQGKSKTSRQELRYLSKHGCFRWVEAHAWLTIGPTGEVQGVSGTLSDITERKQAGARMQLAASVFSHAREGIIITDADGDIIEVNDAFCRITGYRREEVLGKNPRILQSGRQSPEYYAAMWKALHEQDYWSGEIWNRRKSGEVYAEMLTISTIRDAAGTPLNYVALFSDITVLKEHQDRLEFLAHYDALTSLPNRVLLGDRLQQAMVKCRRNNKPLAVVYLDLDGFKAINDNHGHDLGDELLVVIAQRLKAALREGDTLARLGGDEFVAVITDLENTHDCEFVLARLLQAASDPVPIGSTVLHVSASIGATLYPDDSVVADQLLRHADQAMYVAKQSGKNRFHFFDAAQDSSVRDHCENLERIRRALETGEFVLFYQPKVNMRTGALIGAEALIRWQHPDQGLLPPDAFLPVVENHVLSAEIDEWVLDTALAQMAEWQKAGLLIPVSVNTGARLLQQSNFVESLSERLARYPELPADFLELEVVETSALNDMAHASNVMHACRKIGVRFALDDFGTGYSSLTYLRRLPVDLLKIDQSFVFDMLHDQDDLAIVNGVVGLAAAFRREVIAEGVETVAHGELLLPLGCVLGQGYGIARPMPARDLPVWASSWRPDPRWTVWCNREFKRSDLPILLAQVEHRAWIRSLERSLNANGCAPPPMDEHQCRFGAWYDGPGRASHADHPAYQALLPIHRRVHQLGREILTLRDQSHSVDAQLKLAELHEVRAVLIDQLNVLLGTGHGA